MRFLPVGRRRLLDPRALSPDPTAPSDADDPVLAELRRRVVEPVVRSLVRDDELDELGLRWSTTPGEVSVIVRARGEQFRHELLLERVARELSGLTPAEAAHAAERLADDLEGQVCVSDFAWAERREARYVLPD